jgi:hypothetical protein
MAGFRQFRTRYKRSYRFNSGISLTHAGPVQLKVRTGFRGADHELTHLTGHQNLITRGAKGRVNVPQSDLLYRSRIAAVLGEVRFKGLRQGLGLRLVLVACASVGARRPQPGMLRTSAKLGTIASVRSCTMTIRRARKTRFIPSIVTPLGDHEQGAGS